MANERRYKLLYLYPETLLNCFHVDINEVTRGYESYCINKITIPDLPKNYGVMSITWDYRLAAFGILIYSESFNIVPDFEIPPTLDIKSQIIVLDLTKLRANHAI